MMSGLDETFFGRNAVAVAAELVGCSLLFQGAGGMITETEAYTPDDPASHSFTGISERNKSMFGPPGRAYVYRCYGIHWCLNVVCSVGSAVLIRALEPTTDIAVMTARRKLSSIGLLCSGPGRLCEALAISREQDGLRLTEAPFSITRKLAKAQVCIGKRIGISKARDNPWRFGLKDSAFLSRKF